MRVAPGPILFRGVQDLADRVWYVRTAFTGFLLYSVGHMRVCAQYAHNALHNSRVYMRMYLRSMCALFLQHFLCILCGMCGDVRMHLGYVRGTCIMGSTMEGYVRANICIYVQGMCGAPGLPPWYVHMGVRMLLPGHGM